MCLACSSRFSFHSVDLGPYGGEFDLVRVRFPSEYISFCVFLYFCTWSYLLPSFQSQISFSLGWRFLLPALPLSDLRSVNDVCL